MTTGGGNPLRTRHAPCPPADSGTPAALLVQHKRDSVELPRVRAALKLNQDSRPMIQPAHQCLDLLMKRPEGIVP